MQQSPDTLTFTVASTVLLDEVRIGTAALLGDEVVRVDALVASTGLLTVARGCADTVPTAHVSGTRLWFYDDFASADSTEYSSGVAMEAIALPFTGTAVLDIGSASIYSLTLDQRAYRPYPPGALQFNGAAYPDTVGGEITVSWSHRDRLLQADQLVDTSAGHIGPEAGTSYRLQIYLGATLLRTYTTSSTSQIYLSADEIADGGPFSALRFVLDSLRDGVYSRQAHDWTVSRA